MGIGYVEIAEAVETMAKVTARAFSLSTRRAPFIDFLVFAVRRRHFSAPFLRALFLGRKGAATRFGGGRNMLVLRTLYRHLLECAEKDGSHF